MIKYNNTNNASTTLTAWISPSSTTLIVENGDILPTAPFLLTLEHFDNEKVTVREIVKCIAKAWNILTIQRGAWTCVQDDSATPKAQNNTPHSFSVWDCASIYWTSEQVQDIQNEIEKKLNIDDFQAWTYVYGATSTWTDAYSITIPWTLTSYSVGQVFRFMADVDNEWNATLNINGIWEKEILKNHDQHLQSGDIEAGQIVEVAYDGTNFQMDSQIASVISLDDISSLSYNDTTCYAWEEIHENDLIVTNGNSFNPDRTDESTDVWGQTVNKYAIWFIWNGESTDTFSIKTSVIEWYEPNSVTVNIESDNNWKPSGTVLATTTDLNSLKIKENFSSLQDVYSNKNTYDSVNIFLNYFLKKDFSNWDNCFQKVSGVLTIPASLAWTEKQFDFTTVSSSTTFKYFNNRTNVFVFFSRGGKLNLVKVNDFNKSNDFTFLWEYEISRSPTNVDAYIFMAIDDSGKNIYCCEWSSWNTTITVLKTETPYDFTNHTVSTYAVWAYFYKPQFIKLHNGFCLAWLTSNHSMIICNIDNNWDITSHTVYNNNIRGTYMIEYFEKDYEIYIAQTYDSSWSNTGRKIIQPWYWFSYTPWITKTIFSSNVQTVKWTKYWLTIAPVVTWSVVDSIKIYDKEGEYYSECAVKDLNSWSNVSNKTPYIDAICIKARYAREVNEDDNLEKVPCGFSNGDFTGLETVSYCFQWAKSGFSWLDPDTLYYSDWTWWITETANTYSVWKAVNTNTLLTNIKTA